MTALATSHDVPDADLGWLRSILTDLAAVTSGLSGWEVALWEGGVRVTLQADQQVHLDLHARVEGNSYASTPSLSLFARLDGDMTYATKCVVEDFVAALRAADDGSLTLAKGEHVHVDAPVDRDDAPLTLQDVLAWNSAAQQYRERLHMCSFFALKTILTDDLYPHVCLGSPIAEEEIKESWREVDRLMRAGRAPDKLGIYVHVPYCTVECGFCYCGKTQEFDRGDVDQYTLNLLAELEEYGELVQGQQITSVYFGGGTPSLLTPVAMRRIFETLYERYDVPEGTQVIFEGNPDSLKPNKVEILGTLGRVTRLTIGIQTLDPTVQEYVKRFNRKEDIEAAIKAAKDVGIPHVNFDCIAGLQGQTMDSWKRDVDYLLSLGPDSLHINGFRPLPRTLYTKRGQALEPGQEELRDAMMRWAEERLEEVGFSETLGQGPHRTRNAANLQEYDLRTQNSSLLGFGYPARSHSFGGFYYVRDTTKGFVPSLREQNAGERRYSGIRADLREEMHKYVVTNIRGGFDRGDFRRLFGEDAVDVMAEGFKALQDLGAVEITPERVRFRTGRQVDALVYRLFFYSDQMARLAMEAWGSEYDPSEDYMAHLEYLVPKAD
ncbi:MAG: radical SAM protein [Alphaproteobacteria bacterium]|nr:radical SAM protein [Alphaproteobacteria bacterium]